MSHFLGSGVGGGHGPPIVEKLDLLPHLTYFLLLHRHACFLEGRYTKNGSIC